MPPALRITELEQQSSNIGSHQNCPEGFLNIGTGPTQRSEVWDEALESAFSHSQEMLVFLAQGPHFGDNSARGRHSPFCLFQACLPLWKEWLISLLSAGEETVCSAEQLPPFFLQMCELGDAMCQSKLCKGRRRAYSCFCFGLVWFGKQSLV